MSGMLTSMESRKSVALLGLLALLVLDIVLIAWALWPNSASTAATPRGPIAATTAVPTLAEGEGDTAEPSDDVSAGPPAPVTRLVAGVNADIVWVADAGSCGRPGAVHVTTTAGEEWSTREAPGSVLRLRPTDASSGFVVGGDGDCAAQVWYTGDAGDSWSAPQPAADAWGRDPDSVQRVLRPGADPVQPCTTDVLDMVGLPAGAAVVLCADGAIRATSDRGASWSTTDSREGLLAISFPAAGEGAAAALADDCPGVAVMPVADSRLGESVCVEDASYASGQVAISLAQDAVWLVAGDGVWRADRLDGPFEAVSAWPGD